METEQPQLDPMAQPEPQQDERVDSAAQSGPAGDFGLGQRVYGYIGTLAHIVGDGRTTLCGKEIDQTSPTQLLARSPGGMICGSCLGAAAGA